MHSKIFLLSFLVFSAHLLLAQPAKMSVAIVALNGPATAENLAKLEKMELAVWLPDTYQNKINNFLREEKVPAEYRINPFLEWELDIQATFTHAASGTIKKVDAFYFREYERDAANNSWNDLETRSPMRIRFAPPFAGDWTCSVVLKINGKETGPECSLTFQVKDSKRPGYVKVHPNHRNFELDGKLIYPVGTNFPSPIRDVEIYHTGPNWTANFQPDETHKVTSLKSWLTYHNDIKAYEQAGGKYIRTLQSGWSTLLEFEKKGNYYDRLNYAWEQDQLLEFCEEKGIYVLFDLMEQEPFMKYGNYHMFDWDWSHYNADGTYAVNDKYPAYCYADGQAKEPHDMFLNEDDLRYHEQRTRYYISRYGYSTSIYLFELLSEPWHMDQFGGRPEVYVERTPEGAIARKAVQNYHQRMARYIKTDLGHIEHLIGIDFFMINYLEADPVYDSSLASPYVDVIGFNEYSPVPDKLVISKSGNPLEVDPSENSLYHLVDWIYQRSGKPVIISEGGAGDGVDECSGYAQQTVDMMTFGFSGLAAYNSWAGWANNQQHTWPMVISAQQFMATAPVSNTLSNGVWKQGRQAERRRSSEKKVKELQYFLSEDGTLAAGYVKNRSFNFHTKRMAPACNNPSLVVGYPVDTLIDVSWEDGKPLTVVGLKKRKHYAVHWYDYKTGQQIAVEEQKARGGKLKLHFPELTVTPGKAGRPVLWFSIEPVTDVTRQEVENHKMKENGPGL